MRRQLMNEIILRAPEPHETARVLHLFRQINVPPLSQVLLAVKTRPIERFVAAVAGWTEGEFARFQLAFQPGADQQHLAKLLIDEAAATARRAGRTQLVYGELLTDDDERAALLRANGFEVLRSERFFRADAVLAENRVHDLTRKFQQLIPQNWRTESICERSPEIIMELIAPFRLMPPEEIRRYWKSNSVHGFEPTMSNILFEETRPFGVLLVRREGEVLSFDVRVVNHPNARWRGLANLPLLQHCVKHYDRENYPVRWIQFRGGEMEHRETANLAFRMGGEEMAPRRVFAKTL